MNAVNVQSMELSPATVTAPGNVLMTLTDIQKSYFNAEIETPVLHGINVSIQRGEFVAIMGQSGSGKSTLMNILGCLDTPTSGSFVLNGKEVGTLNDNELAKIRNETIGFVFHCGFWRARYR